MKWWIGQVTDPDKGEWGDSLLKQQVEDGKDVAKFRCRVRIVGYHGSDDDLPDKDLPLGMFFYHQMLVQLVDARKHAISRWRGCSWILR